MFPVRCFTCNRVIADRIVRYEKAIAEGRDPEEVLDELKVMSMCCRIHFLTYVDTITEELEYCKIDN